MLWSDRCLLKAHVVCCAEWIEGNRGNLHGPVRRRRWGGRLGSFCCCNNLPQTLWCKSTQTCYPIVWRSEVWNEFPWAKMKVWAGLVPLEVLGENLVFAFLFWFLEATCICWLLGPSASSDLPLSFWLLLPSSPLLLWLWFLCSLLIRTLLMTLDSPE